MENKIPYFLTINRQNQKAVLEALIFSSEEIVTLNSLFNIITEKDDYLARFSDEELAEYKGISEDGIIGDDAFELKAENDFGVNKTLLVELINEINEDLKSSNRPYQIVNYSGGYQFATAPEFGELVQYLVKTRSRKRFTQAMLETLAIIAYRQPVTKPVIEQIRGVNSKEVIHSLTDKNLVKIVGRAETIGKPLLYGTTDEFLKIFGLNSLKDMPSLKEIDDFAEETLKKSEEEGEANFTLTLSQETLDVFKDKKIEIEFDDTEPNYISSDINLN